MDDKRSDTVLVVEDDALLRMYATGLLEESGYTVLEAPDAASALALLERRSGVRLLFTDIEMPGEHNGLTLARRVHERWPHILLLLASGGVTPAAEEIPDSGHFVAKPYQGEIVDEVSKMIEEAPLAKTPGID